MEPPNQSAPAPFQTPLRFSCHSRLTPRRFNLFHLARNLHCSCCSSRNQLRGRRVKRHQLMRGCHVRKRELTDS